MRDLSKYSDNYMEIDIFPKGKIFRFMFDSKINKMRVITNSNNAFDELKSTFSTVNSTSFFAKQYGYNISPRFYEINQFGYFESGLLFEILAHIKRQYGSLDVVAISKNCKNYIEDFLKPLHNVFYEKNINGNIELFNVSEDNGRNEQLVSLGKSAYEFRQYQANAIKALLLKGYGRGLVELPTSSGKSFIIANLIWNIYKYVDQSYRALILVPNTQLVAQFYSDLLDYGYHKDDLTKMTGAQKKELFNPNAKIIIANRQYVFNHLDLLPKIDILVCDEAHTTASESTKNFIENLNCQIKVGCSGTLNVLNQHQKWQLIGMFGKILYTEDIVKLQSQGFITPLKISLINVFDSIVDKDESILFSLNAAKKYNESDFSIMFDDAYKSELDYFVKHYKELYDPVLRYLSTLDDNILCLFDRLDIGKNLAEYAKQLYPDKNVYYIDGSTKVEEREKIRSAVELSGNNIIIAQSTIFSTGINIKRLFHICFIFNTKAATKVIQSIGRTLRLYKDKKYAHLIDVVFNYKYSKRHYSERKKLYKSIYNKKPDEIIDIKI